MERLLSKLLLCTLCFKYPFQAVCTGIPIYYLLTPIYFTFIITALMGWKFKENTWDMKTLTSKINQKCRDVKI